MRPTFVNYYLPRAFAKNRALGLISGAGIATRRGYTGDDVAVLKIQAHVRPIDALDFVA